MLPTCFDSTALSNTRVPLPLSKEEHVLLFCDDVYFRFFSSAPYRAIECLSGRVFLTSERVVFVPSCCEAPFKSFFAPLKRVLIVDSEISFDFLCESSFVATVGLNFRSWSPGLFFETLNKALKDVVVELDPEWIAEDEPIPLYSELVDTD